MAALRPPSSRPLKLLFGYSTEVYSNEGFTFQFEDGEAAICPGAGTVASVVRRFAKFKHTNSLLTGTPTYEVTIVHGHGIQTVVAGLASVSARPGNQIGRGDILGQPATNEVFFGVQYMRKTFNPNELGRHWWLQGEYVPGQAGNLRQGPDKIIRNFAGTIFSTIYSGIRYFMDRVRGFKPLLVNIDFNGNSTKTGFAALGFTDADYWNVYTAGAFNWLSNLNGCYYYYYAYGACGPTKVFNKSPQTFLNDSTGVKSPVWLERVAAATAASGTLSSWDAMLSTWIGGWTGVLPEENFFAIRGLTAGTYRLCLYANNISRTPPYNTTFGAAVDNDPPVWKTTSLWPSATFQEGGNYVQYDLTVPAGSLISVKVYGYLDGLQIERLS